MSCLHNAIFPTSYQKLIVSAEVATVRFVFEPCKLSADLSGHRIIDDDLQTPIVCSTAACLQRTVSCKFLLPSNNAYPGRAGDGKMVWVLLSETDV